MFVNNINKIFVCSFENSIIINISINTLDSHMNQININNTNYLDNNTNYIDNNTNYIDNNNINQMYNKYPIIQLPNGDRY